MISLRRPVMAALLVVAVTACGDRAILPPDPDPPVAASALNGASPGSASIYEDRMQHARFYPDVGDFGVIRQCQSNPIEDADGNDWTMVRRRGGDTFSKMVEPQGAVMVREVELTAGDYDAGGEVIVPGYTDDRWVVTHVGIGHITIALWRDALARPIALNSNVHADAAPIGPEDDWISIFDESGDEVGGAHDLRNEVFTPASRAHVRIEEEVAEHRADRTLDRLTCDAHVWYTGGEPSWIQRNDVLVR